MNNVTQTRVRKNDISKEEGTGKEFFALFCCSLFAFIQLIFFFDIAPGTSQSKIEILAVNDRSLVINDPSRHDFFVTNPPCLSFENLNLSPFFFLPVAINHCDKSLLMSVSGIGPGLAERILQRRDEAGPFLTPEELLEVRGIGPARLKKFVSHLNFENYHE